MRYENFYCSNLDADQPEWFDITLDAKDIANIKQAQSLITDDLLRIEFVFHGQAEWEGYYHLEHFCLIVTDYSVWVGCYEKHTTDLYEIHLETENENN